MNKLSIDLLESVEQECREELEVIDLPEEKRVVLEQTIKQINDIIKEAVESTKL